MTIARTAYDTQACQGFVLKPLHDALTKALLISNMQSVANEMTLRQVTGASSFEVAIPGFFHPYEVPNVSGPQDDQVTIVADMRPFGRYDQQQMRYEVKNFADHFLAQHRQLLNHLWLNGNGVEILREISHLPTQFFSDLISEGVTRRLNLDGREKLDLAILAGWFYQSQFTNDEKLSEREMLRMVTAVAKGVRIGVQEVMSVTDQLEGPIHSVAEFCQKAEQITKSVRLRELNLGVLFQIIAGNWFGTHAAEIMTVALEHPPTWIALLYSAAEDRTFKKSGLTRLVEKARAPDVTQFVRSIDRILHAHYEAYDDRPYGVRG